MIKQTRILLGVTTKSHTEIAEDEMYGLQEIGYACDQFEFGGKKNIKSSFARLLIILNNAINLVIKSYIFKPDFIYFNSRVEYIGCIRDFLTIMVVRAFYYRKVFFVIKSHGSNLEVFESKQFLIKNIVIPYLKRQVKGWLFLSTEELTWIVSGKLLDEHRIFLTKNIVRPEKFQIENGFRSKFNIPEEYTILLFVGRVIKEKGLFYVVDAFAAIRVHFKVFLVIVGDGEELVTINEKIEALNIKKDVIVTGWIDETKVAYYTSNSDVLVYPTFAPEGFPMALFNSLAAGLSIITTPIRAAYDYLEEPNNCLWVEPKSSSSIIEALKKLLGNVEIMEKMRINNKKKSHIFTKKVVSLELAEILHSIQSNTYNKSFQEVRK